jgi:transcriptional regulator with XRE-family HTH domain
MQLKANMLDINLKTPKDVRAAIAAQAKEKRLALNLSQKELAELSGVSLGSLKRFETTGLVSLASLLEIALVLKCLADFDALFKTEGITSLFAPEKKKIYRKGRKNGWAPKNRTN